MTCQLALSSRCGGVLFADSQMSSARAEYHGYQKQFVGNDFLLGAAGNTPIILELFDSLIDQKSGECNVCSVRISDHILEFLNKNVTTRAAINTAFVLIYSPQSGNAQVQTLIPSNFKSFTLVKKSWAALGSGSEFVNSAIERDKNLGIYSEPQQLVDMIVTGENYLDVATKSLTVNAQYTIGILKSNKAYIIGDPRISAQFVPPAVLSSWKDVANRYEKILARTQQIRGEIREAQRALSDIQVSNFGQAGMRFICDAKSSIEDNRDSLRDEIESFFAWYDSLVGR